MQNIIVIFLICDLLVTCVFPTLSRYTTPEMMNLQTIIKTGLYIILIYCWLVYRSLKQITLNTTSSNYFFLFFYFFIFLVGFFLYSVIIASQSKGNLENYILLFKLLGFPYVVITIIAFYEIKNMDWLNFLCKSIAFIGFFASIIAIIQYIVGPSFIELTGMNTLVGNLHFSLHTAKLSDESYAFRPFSLFQTHYDLTAFLTLSLMAISLLFTQNHIKKSTYILLLFIGIAGLLTTHNVTAYILIIIYFSIIHKNNDSDISFNKFNNKNFTLKVLQFGFLLIMFLLILFQTTFGDRVLTIFNNYQDSTLFYRILFMKNSIEAFFDKPYGWGWIYAVKGGYQLPYWITSDNFYLWVTVFGGGVFVLLFFGLRTLPLIAARKLIKKNNEYRIIWAWCMISMLCGLSNAFISNSGSSVFFYWFFLGFLLKMPLLKNN
ncbi:MAG: hypothetical protein HQK65_07995 [Desulfamplus sp.]|nr:hypothetical protein [Desulfamplus sp.]